MRPWELSTLLAGWPPSRCSGRCLARTSRFSSQLLLDVSRLIHSNDHHINQIWKTARIHSLHALTLLARTVFAILPNSPFFYRPVHPPVLYWFMWSPCRCKFPHLLIHFPNSSMNDFVVAVCLFITILCSYDVTLSLILCSLPLFVNFPKLTVLVSRVHRSFTLPAYSYEQA